MGSACAVAEPVSAIPRAVVSFQDHAAACQQSVTCLWEQIEEMGMTTREMFEFMRHKSTKSLTIGALQQAAHNQNRPLTVLNVSTERRALYDKHLLVVALILVTEYHFPVIIMPNGRGKDGGYENRLVILSEPPDYVRK